MGVPCKNPTHARALLALVGFKRQGSMLGPLKLKVMDVERAFGKPNPYMVELNKDGMEKREKKEDRWNLVNLNKRAAKKACHADDSHMADEGKSKALNIW